MPLRVDDTKPIIEGWVVRGDELRRIFAQRPASLRETLGEAFQVALQEVESGVVKAWSPLWRGILTREGIQEMAAQMESEGWSVHPFRPVKIDFAAVGRRGAALPRPPKVDLDQPKGAHGPPALTHLERAKAELRLVRERERKRRAYEAKLRRQHPKAS